MTQSPYQAILSEVEMFYEMTGRFFEIIWGESIHFGLWPQGEEHLSFPEAQERMTELMISKTDIKPGQRFLDVGCGTGVPAVRLARKTGCNVLGITISHNQVAQATRRAADEKLSEQVQFQYADAMAMPFESESFDGAWAFESFLNIPDLSLALREIKRVLKPGARLVIADLIETGAMSEEVRGLLTTMWQWRTQMTLPRYEALLREAGLELIDSQNVSKDVSLVFDKSAERVAQRASQIEQELGPMFLSAMVDIQPKVQGLFPSTAGYILLTVRKPLSEGKPGV